MSSLKIVKHCVVGLCAWDWYRSSPNLKLANKLLCSEDGFTKFSRYTGYEPPPLTVILLDSLTLDATPLMQNPEMKTYCILSCACSALRVS